MTNNEKNHTTSIFTAFMLLSFILMQLNAATESILSATVALKPVESAEAYALIFRLDEI
jgi:hypothetical protein